MRSGGRVMIVAAALGLLVVGVTTVVVVRVLNREPTVPLQYRGLVSAAASTCHGLDARVLAAQIQQESGWDPTATSDRGAQGIAQFLPRVWTAYAVDGNGDGVKDVWNPKDAIPSAARFDCVLLRQVATVPGDRVSNMLAAYNAGPDTVRRYGGVPPYPQTRAYVSRILQLAAVLTLSPVR
jgi:soluble lytic murein transglycosylase-like protein